MYTDKEKCDKTNQQIQDLNKTLEVASENLISVMIEMKIVDDRKKYEIYGRKEKTLQLNKKVQENRRCWMKRHHRMKRDIKESSKTQR